MKHLAFPSLYRLTLSALFCALLAGCAGKSSSNAAANKSSENKPLKATKPQLSKEQKLRKALGLGPSDGVFQAEKEGRITFVSLERTGVKDLSPLAGLPLVELRLNFTGVTDISAVKDMPLEYLNLQGTQVKDITPVKTLNKLKILWLNDTPVTDLSPLRDTTPESLDISGTPVTDLSPIAGISSLQRLNLARSKVNDLTPLRGLTLRRVILTPDKSMKGLDILRTMPTIKEMYTYMPEPVGNAPPQPLLSRDRFFELFDNGTLPRGK